MDQHPLNTGTVVFEGTSAVVVTNLSGDGQDVVITFTSRRLSPRRERAGFGVDFFLKRGIPAVHIISLQNHWWQVPEMDAVIEAVNALNLKSRFRSITTYGSSMGGHGALVFSERLQADRALVFSPQFALHGRESAWNPVWARETVDLTEIYRFEDGCSLTADILICVDPRHDNDMAHIRAMQRYRKIRTISIPFGGHPPMKYLQDGRLLTPLVDAVLGDRLDLPNFLKKLRSNRRTNLRYLLGMARENRSRRSKAGHEIQKMALSEIRNRLVQGRPFPTPGDAAALIELACTDDEGLPLLDKLKDRYPNDPAILTARYRMLLSCDPDAALRSAKQALRLNRKNVDLRLNVVQALYALNRRDEARANLITALSLPERNPSVWTRFLARNKGILDNEMREAIGSKTAVRAR